MGRQKGSTNDGKNEKNDIINIRVSSEFKAEVYAALNNSYLSGRQTITEFCRDAIARHVRYTANDINKINNEALEE